MVVDLAKARLYLENVVRMTDPDRLAGVGGTPGPGTQACFWFGTMVYAPGQSYHEAAKEALAEIAKLDTDEIHNYPDGRS